MTTHAGDSQVMMTNANNDSLQMYDVIARRAREERPPVTVFKGYPMASMDDICCSTGV